MALVRFKDLCIDAVDPTLMAEFWGRVLGLEVQSAPSGAKLTGETAEQTIWINRVPEAKSVKHRVHLDVHAATDDVPGATPVSAPGEFRWRVMADPEGGEFCVFVREAVPDHRLYEVCVDCADAGAQAAWWGEVLGVPAQPDDDGWFWLEEVPGLPCDGIVFVPVPEPKTVKNRVHWDVTAAESGAIDELARRGARVLRAPDDEITWSVLADPEGNEFCVFAP